jgi:hypothetical protein
MAEPEECTDDAIFDAIFEGDTGRVTEKDGKVVRIYYGQGGDGIYAVLNGLALVWNKLCKIEQQLPDPPAESEKGEDDGA